MFLFTLIYSLFVLHTTRMRVLLILFLLIVVTNGANILGVFTSISKSHYFMGETILKELARRGHKVIMISGFGLEEAQENFTNITVPELLPTKEMEKPLQLYLQEYVMLTRERHEILQKQLLSLAKNLFENEKFQKLLTLDQQFDVVILDYYYNEEHFVLGHLFKAPVIVCSTAGSVEQINFLVSNPTPFSYVPNKLLRLSNDMTLLERTLNTVTSLGMSFQLANTKRVDDVVASYFPGVPSIKDLKKDVALVLSNSHFSFETPRPQVPAIINIGGCHIRPTKELPEDLEEFLDAADHGVIYFNMGSNIKSIYINNDAMQSILKVFSKTKMKVLMKWENDVMENKPDNVMVKKWLPQNDILAHPKVKVFITHGGLMSLIEAIYHGVPVIGIPIYADQISNVPKALEDGYGLRLDYTNITEETLTDAIEEVVTNPSYVENIRKRSELLRNQPIPPLDLAIFWVEHVIRHKGAPHLKTKAHNLHWYQLYLIDVILVIGIGFFVIIFGSIFSTMLFWNHYILPALRKKIE